MKKITTKEATMLFASKDDEQVINLANKIVGVCDKYKDLAVDCSNIERHMVIDGSSFLGVISVLTSGDKEDSTIVNFKATGEDEKIESFFSELKEIAIGA